MNGPHALLAGMALLSCAGLTQAGLIAPQSADDRAALLADDLRFAEALAISRFYDIASEVVRNTQTQIDNLGRDEVGLAGEAALIESRIVMRHADSLADPVERMAALDDAIVKLKDWTNPGTPFAVHDRMVDALADLATTLRKRGQEWARQAADGDAAARSRADADFDLADETYKDLQNEAEDRAEQLESYEQGDAAQAMVDLANRTYYWRGLNAVEWADVSAARDVKLEDAIDLLDEFGWEVSTEAPVYYYSLFEQGRALDKLGETEDARDILASILENASYLWDNVDTYSVPLQRYVAGLFDGVWGFLALMDADADNLAGGTQRIEAMLAAHAEKGIPVAREGHRVLLTWARRLSDLGLATEASDIAQRVAKEARGTPAGSDAAILLSALISGSGGAGGVTVNSPDALMLAASGAYAEQDYSQAAFFYERAGAMLTTPADAQTFAYDAWSGAGRSLRNLGRLLEAAIAFEQALDAAQAHHAGDIDRLESAAYLMYTSYGNRFSNTKDAFDKKLRDDASERIRAIPGISLDVQYSKAEEAFGEILDGDTAAFLAVLAEFEAVPETSPNYERALVYSARCLRGAGRLDDALARFNQMEQRVADPSLTPTLDGPRNKREIALAQERYFQARLLLTPEVNRPLDVLTLLKGFETAVPGQPNFHHLVKYQRVVAHAFAGQVAEAEAALVVLMDAVGDTQQSSVSTAAHRVATALERACRVLQQEGGQPAEARELLRRAADTLTIYLEASGYTSFANNMTAGHWYLEAEEPVSAQETFQKALQVHQDISPAGLNEAEQGLATAFDRQADFGRARPLWNGLLNRNPKSVSIRRGAARSFGGWLQVDDAGTITEVPGSGDYAHAHDLWVELYKAHKAGSKYTNIWWESKLGAIDSWYRQLTSNPEKADQARTVLDQLKLGTPEYDRDTMGRIDEDLRYETLFRPLFRYLDKKLPQ